MEQHRKPEARRSKSARERPGRPGRSMAAHSPLNADCSPSNELVQRDVPLGLSKVAANDSSDAAHGGHSLCQALWWSACS